MRAILVLLATVSVCVAQEGSAEKLIEAGHWKRARALVERRLREAPGDANATFLLSQIRAAFGDRTSPLDLAAKAVRLDGSVARYHRQLAEVQGIMAQGAGVFQQVMLARRFRKEIDAALALDPHDTQALRDLLEFDLLAPGIVGGDAAKAAALADRIASINSCEGFLAKARIAESRKDTAQQQQLLRRAADAVPPSYKAKAMLAEFHLADRRDESTAEALARTAVALDSGRADAYCILAAIYAGRVNLDALDALLPAAAEAVPDDLTPYYRAAERLLADRREPARAEQYLRTYLALEPEGNRPTAANAHWKLGDALRAQGKDADAVHEWKAAIQLDPESPALRELKLMRNGSAGNPLNPTKNGGGN